MHTAYHYAVGRCLHIEIEIRECSLLCRAVNQTHDIHIPTLERRAYNPHFYPRPQSTIAPVAMTTTKPPKTEADDAAAEWKFLDEIYTLLNDNGVLNTMPTDTIVRFRHPDELKVSLAGQCFPRQT